MPVHIERRNRLWRLVEPGGGIAMTDKGNPRDGGGHRSRKAAGKQARAMNRAYRD